MRRLMYRIITADNTYFNTVSYAEATAEGNKIVSTFLVEIGKTEEQKKKDAEIRKRREKILAEKALLNKERR